MRSDPITRRKLTDEQVLDIYWRVLAGESSVAIANEYGIHRSAVSKIKLGQTWADITRQHPWPPPTTPVVDATPPLWGVS